MKKEFLKIRPQYFVDDSGNKTSVLLDIQTFENMLEILEDVYFGEQAEKVLADGDFVDFNEANKKVLKK